MIREYLRVTPTSDKLNPEVISTTLGSLHKLSADESAGLISRVNPVSGGRPVTFEFLGISEGTDEPVEFYYGSDGSLDVLQQRLRAMYPDSFDIDKVEFDIVTKLIQSGESHPVDSHDNQPPTSPQENDLVDSVKAWSAPLEPDGGRTQEPLSAQELRPVGVQWRGSVDRRKDWMTSLSELSDTVGTPSKQTAEKDADSGPAPLAPLIDQLTDARQPLAFQVVFKPKPDWSRQASRRAGSLLAGKDTLVQKLLSIESPGPHREGRKTHRGQPLEVPHSNQQSQNKRRLHDQERDHRTRTRLDLLRENSPKRTFTVNARLIALSTNQNRADLETRLDTLCSVFDPIDGPFYEIEGERIRARGLVERTAEKHAWNTLDRIRSRSFRTRRRDQIPRLTNRSDCRPNLVLNPDELANLVAVPSSSDLTVEGSRGTRAEQRSRNPLPRPDHDITQQLREPG